MTSPRRTLPNVLLLDKVNAVFSRDLRDARHIRYAWLREFLSAAREKFLEA